MAPHDMIAPSGISETEERYPIASAIMAKLDDFADSVVQQGRKHEDSPFMRVKERRYLTPRGGKSNNEGE